MERLIREIRMRLGMSQTEFASKLNITFATVNRWENGRAVPNRLAQTAIYKICMENSLPIYDLIIEKIKKISDSIEKTENTVVLYHGSKSGIEGEIAPVSRKQCDFGRGFYMGDEPSQALTLICDYEDSVFYILSVNMSELSVLNVPADIEWAMLVAYHRGKMEKISDSEYYRKYSDILQGKDIVIGSIADDRMFYVIDNFFIGNITDSALVNSLCALQLGKQYVAVSKRACRAIKVEAEIKLSHLERMCIRDVSEQNRARGVSLANEICKKHRREGLFFDEILDNAQKGNRK